MIKTITKEEELREKIVKLALSLHKRPYKHDYFVPDSFDCVSFIIYIYTMNMNIDLLKDGYGLSTTTMLMTSSAGVLSYFEEGTINHDFSNLKKGDILFFHRQSMNDFEPREDNRYPGHCGIYLGDNRVIHATSYYHHVAFNNLETSEFWTRKLVASKNIISYS